MHANRKKRLFVHLKRKEQEGESIVIQLGSRTFELAYENKNGWNFEAFRDRYSDVLDRYDYIVGDWGYNQLRLKGFFRDGNPKGSKESSISSLQEYIQEYCNFGCAYFVLERVPAKKKAGEQTPSVQEEPKSPSHRQHTASTQEKEKVQQRNHTRQDHPRQERNRGQRSTKERLNQNQS